MIKENRELMIIVDKARVEKKISKNDILNVIDEFCDEYDELINLLNEEHITVTDDEDTLSLLNDPEFTKFSSEVENEIKTKDIEDLVSTSTVLSADESIKMYLKEIGQIPLLSTSREIELARTIQEGLSAEKMLKQIKDGVKKSTPEEIAKLEDKVEDGMDANETLTISNLRLVVSIAKKFYGRGMPIDDLIQEGNMGLTKAVKKFDPTMGFKFSTYATWWIKQAISRSIADQARAIRIPVHTGEQISRMNKIQKKLTQELQREPTDYEIAKAMNEKVEKIRQLKKDALEPLSIDKNRGEDEDTTLLDYVPDTQSLNPLEYTMNENFKEEINGILEELNEKEEKVIRLRYGLFDGRSHTLEEVGNEFGLTRERIRQIESKALRKLRHPSRINRIKKLK